MNEKVYSLEKEFNKLENRTVRVVDMSCNSWLCAQEKDVASSRGFELFYYPLSNGRTTAHPVETEN